MVKNERYNERLLNNIDGLIIGLSKEFNLDGVVVKRDVCYLEGRKFRRVAEKEGYNILKSFYYSAIGEMRKEYRLRVESLNNGVFLSYLGVDLKK